MSRLEVPIESDIHAVTGDLLLRAKVGLWLKDTSGNWTLEVFRADPGSDISAMPAWHAKALGLPMPQAGVTIPLDTAAGRVPVVIRSGWLWVKIDGLSPKEHAIPCHFRGDPDAVPALGSYTSLPRNLLGLSGVVDKWQLTFNGTPLSMAAPNGVFVVEEI